MVISWILFVSTGIVLARYYRHILPNFKTCGLEFWFFIHRPIMLLATIFSLVGFFVILAALKGNWVSTKDKVEFSHSIFGILTIILSVVQVPILCLNASIKIETFFFIVNFRLRAL